MILLEESIAKRKMPANLSEGDLPLFNNALQTKIYSVKLLNFKKAGINEHSVIFENFKICPESFIEASRIDQFKNPRKRFKYLFRNYFLRKKIKIKEQCLWFTDSWSHEYFHWITDALPRLMTVKDYIKDSQVILPYNYQNIDYIQRSLKTFGIQKINYIFPNSVVWPEKLVVPTHTGPTGNYNEALMVKLRDHFLEYYKGKTSSYGDKIYISRGKSLRRKIVNEQELISLLEKYGFKTLYFEEFNFDEQVKIISNAQYLISNHGAGLTNMLFMQPGSFVFELRREGDNHNNCYFSLASALDIKYYYQCCPSENNDEDTYTANLIVDVNQLEKNLKKIFYA